MGQTIKFTLFFWSKWEEDTNSHVCHHFFDSLVRIIEFA